MTKLPFRTHVALGVSLAMIAALVGIVYTPVAHAAALSPSWVTKLQAISESPEGQKLAERVKWIAQDEAVRAAMEPTLTAAMQQYAAAKPTAAQIGDDLGQAFADAPTTVPSPALSPAVSLQIAGLVQSPEFQSLIAQVAELNSDPAFLAYAESHSATALSASFQFDLFDTVVNVMRGITYVAVGFAVGVACVGTVGLGCAPAVLLGAVIIGLTETAVAAANDIRSNGRSMRISGVSCTYDACGYTGQAANARWFISRISTFYNYVDNPALVRASSSTYGTDSWQQIADNPNTWNVSGWSYGDSRNHCYAFVEIRVFVYFTDGNYAEDHITAQNPYYSACW